MISPKDLIKFVLDESMPSSEVSPFTMGNHKVLLGIYIILKEG